MTIWLGCPWNGTSEISLKPFLDMQIASKARFPTPIPCPLEQQEGELRRIDSNNQLHQFGCLRNDAQCTRLKTWWSQMEHEGDFNEIPIFAAGSSSSSKCLRTLAFGRVVATHLGHANGNLMLYSRTIGWWAGSTDNILILASTIFFCCGICECWQNQPTLDKAHGRSWICQSSVRAWVKPGMVWKNVTATSPK